ncbi:MAG: hypothetical protein ACQEVA_09170 [Myxococcota bacterium]
MDTRARLKKVLNSVVEDRDLESRWLNTLSLLEFIGARKIGKTMCQTHPSATVLDHWADETRHAYAFKALCERLNQGECTSYLALDAATNYFQQLDQRATEWLRDSVGVDETPLNYLLVTTLIERRAMMVYPLYRAATNHAFIADELQTIVVEEQDHRVELERQCVELLSVHDAELDDVLGLEADLFAGLLHAFGEAVGLED